MSLSKWLTLEFTSTYKWYRAENQEDDLKLY